MSLQTHMLSYQRYRGLTGHAEVELVLDGLLVGELPRSQRPQAQAEGPDVRLGGQLVCNDPDFGVGGFDME